jgi:hypothetical protein
VPDSLAERVADAITTPSPTVSPYRRLWLVGSGPFHDAAELGTLAFAGSGRSAAVVAAEGHARLGELVGPQDLCLLVGGDHDLVAYAERVAAGAGATVIPLDGVADQVGDPTAAFAVAAGRVLTLCRSWDAPGVTDEDLTELVGAVAMAEVAAPAVSREALGRRVIVIGSGPAAVTARHLAVTLRNVDRTIAVEGLDAQDVPGAAADLLAAGTTVLALDPLRDPDAPVAHMARMARAEGSAVIAVTAPEQLGPVAAQIPLAVATARALRRRP